MSTLLIKNAKLLSEEKIELLIGADQKIQAVAPELSIEADREIDLKGEYYISAGWIDSHVHCFEKMDLYYDYPDEIGVRKGVTTIIDAGSSGAENIGEFRDFALKAKTNVRALLNISKWGIIEQDELADLTKINEGLNLTTLEKYSDFIVGLKARMSKSVVGKNNVIPLQLAKKIQKKAMDIPLMVHIGSAPPELQDILQLLEAGDIVTHCYNGKPNGIIGENGKIKHFVWDAYHRGIIFDTGHGTDSFNIKVAKEAYEEGLLCKTISTDIYIRNRENGPVYDLATTMDKLHAAGLSWQEILPKVTKHPAEIFRLKGKGVLAEGADADLTIFKFLKQPKELFDSNGNSFITQESIVPHYCMIAGQLYDTTAGGEINEFKSEI